MTGPAELAQAAVPAFARHETFHPRYGWLRKAFDAPAHGPGVFSLPDATVLLGVGKNMVRAIRYWGLAYKVLAEAADPDHPRLPGVVVSPFGQALLGEDGWDPYLEQPATLWLLHWQLLRPPSRAPAWWALFHALAASRLEEGRLVEDLAELVAATPEWPAVAKSSIKKDVDCALRMYTSRGGTRQGLDDMVDCPFRELGVLEPVAGEPRSYRFMEGRKSSLPDDIVAYICLDFASYASPGSSTITVSRLANEAGGPGRACRLPASALATCLQRVVANEPRLALTSPSGSLQLVFEDDPSATALGLLDRLYAKKGAPTISMALPTHSTSSKVSRERQRASDERSLAAIEAEIDATTNPLDRLALHAQRQQLHQALVGAQ